MDTRGDLLSCLMFGGRWRWSGRSLNIKGDVLFMFVLIYRFLVSGNRWILAALVDSRIGFCALWLPVVVQKIDGY